MDKNAQSFKFHIPIDFTKGGDGKYKIRGLASTEDRDLQGEIVKQSGLDFSPIREGKGLFNWNHKSDPQFILGKIDKAELTDGGTMVEGYLFDKVDNAKAVIQIMESLKPEDKSRIQMSIEGKIVERDSVDPTTINRARVEKVALTLDPVNPSTYAEFAKSLTAPGASEESGSDGYLRIPKTQFDEMMEKIEKTLSIGHSGADAPATRTGGGALARESLDGGVKDTKKRKKKKCMDKSDEDDDQREAEEAELKKLKGMTKKAISDSPEGRKLFKSIVLRLMKRWPDGDLNHVMTNVYNYIDKKIHEGCE
jgi:hypothetical protein